MNDWSDDLGIGSVVSDLLDLAGPLAFLAGLTFGFTFDTSGPRPARVVEEERVEPVPGHEPIRDPEPVPPADAAEPDTPTEVRHEDRETVVTGPSEPGAATRSDTPARR